MNKLLLLLAFITGCTNPNLPETEEVNTEIIETETEATETEEVWSKERAETYALLPNSEIDDLLESVDKLPYYIEGIVNPDGKFIESQTTILALDSMDGFKPGDRVRLWGELTADTVKLEDQEVKTLTIKEMEVLDEFKGTYLGPGLFVIGQDIEPGRYEISGSNLGNIRIYDDAGEVCNEMIGGDGQEGVTKVYVNLVEGYKLELTGIKHSTFIPVEARKPANVLHTGFWEAGVDILVGDYKIKSTTGQAGKIFILTPFGEPKLDHGLGETSEDPEPVISLEEGDIIWIQNMESVSFGKPDNKKQ